MPKIWTPKSDDPLDQRGGIMRITDLLQSIAFEKQPNRKQRRSRYKGEGPYVVTKARSKNRAANKRARAARRRNRV